MSCTNGKRRQMAHTATSSNEWITDTSLAETAQPQLNDQKMAVITHLIARRTICPTITADADPY